MPIAATLLDTFQGNICYSCVCDYMLFRTNLQCHKLPQSVCATCRVFECWNAVSILSLYANIICNRIRNVLLDICTTATTIATKTYYGKQTNFCKLQNFTFNRTQAYVHTYGMYVWSVLAVMSTQNSLHRCS